MLLKRLFTDKLGFAFVHYSLQPSYKTLQMIENYIYTGKKSLIVYARKGFSVHLERRGPETIEYSQDVYVERSWFKPVASEDRKTNRNINVMLLLVNLACHVYVWYVCNRLIFRRFTSIHFVVLLKGHDHWIRLELYSFFLSWVEGCCMHMPNYDWLREFEIKTMDRYMYIPKCNSIKWTTIEAAVFIRRASTMTTLYKIQQTDMWLNNPWIPVFSWT